MYFATAQLHPTIEQLSVITNPRFLGMEKPIHLLRVSRRDLTKVIGVVELRDIGSVRQFGVVSGRSEIKLANSHCSSI
jgi:hypothetical protein